ncbi:hypothetical protein FACS1894217_10830 [Clostridia bacterium]|nr:hypothetical protein FACS1894217_10830 [Clostridia bacterium]
MVSLDKLKSLVYALVTVTIIVSAVCVYGLTHLDTSGLPVLLTLIGLPITLLCLTTAAKINKDCLLTEVGDLPGRVAALEQKLEDLSKR